MADSTHSKPAVANGGGLKMSVSYAALQPPAPRAEETATPQPKAAEAVREQAKAIAAAIAAKLPVGNRATRRALTKAVRAEIRKNPVPTDPNCWLTPKKLIDKILRALGIAAFSIDGASPGAGLSHVPALRHFTKEDPDGCGLQRCWNGPSVWINPPYDAIEAWVAKADEAVRSGRVGIVVALLPNRTGMPWFADHVAGRARVLFLRGRVRFEAEKGVVGESPFFASMLCVWGGTEEQVASLEQAFDAVPLAGRDVQARPAEAGEGQRLHKVGTRLPEEVDVAGDQGQACLRTIDLFTGGGSVHLAMEAAGFATAFANDFCPEKRATFSANFPHVRLDPRSIIDVRGHELPKAGTMLASSPCQDHSKTGKRQGFAGDRGVLAFEVVRLVRELAVLGRAPGVVVFENVLGMLELDDGVDFAALVEALMTEGYDVGALVIDAKLFVPQSRRRVFIVAVRSGTPLPPGLAAGRPSRRWHPNVLRRAHAALSAGARRCWHWWTIPVPPRRIATLADILEPVVPVKAWATEETVAGMVALLPPKEQAKVARAVAEGVRAGIIKERWEREGGARLPHYEVFFDGVARCLQKSEGGKRQRLAVLDAGAANGLRVRDFTPRERARLTGLPDDYMMPNVTRSRRLTGDAVVVPVYEWLARHLIRPLTEAAEARREKAGIVRVVAAQVERRPGNTAEARDAMGQVIVKPGANRPCKQVSVRTEVTNLLEADVEIEAHAREEGVSKAELYRRAYNFYRHHQERALLHGYVPLARSPELRPKAVREAEARRRGRHARQAAGGIGAGEGDITTQRRLAYSIFPAALRPTSRTMVAAQRPGTCRASFPRSGMSAGRGGWRPTWRDGPQEAACWSSRSPARRPWRSDACSRVPSSGPCWSSGSRA